MTTAFQANAFQNNAFQIDSAVVSPSTGGGGFTPHRRVPPDEQRREREHQARRQSRKLERDDTDTRLLQDAWDKAFGVEPDAASPIGTDLSSQQLAALAQRLWEQDKLQADEELAMILLLAL